MFVSCAEYDGEHSRSDRGLPTRNAGEAAVYAALRAPSGRGDVSAVEPLSELEPDPSDCAGTGSYATHERHKERLHPRDRLFRDTRRRRRSEG